jgi:O-antigen ligase
MAGFASARAAPRAANELLLTAVAAVFVTGLALAVTVKAAAAPGPMLFGAVAVTGIATWMAVTDKRPHALAILLLYLCLLDGVLKLRAPVGNELPGLGRDVLLYAIALGMLVPAILKRKPVDVPPMTAWILAFVALVLVQLLNPANGSLLHSVASLRQHIEFVPLFFIGYSVIRSERRLRIFLVLLVFGAAVNGVVGAAQFNLTPEQLSAWGPGYEDLITGGSTNAPRRTEGEDGTLRVRPPALGSDMGFGGVLGSVAIPAGLALLMIGRRRGASVGLLAVLGSGAVLAVATSQARAAVIGALVGLLAFLALASTARRVVRVVVAVGVMAAVSITLLSSVAGSSSTFDRYASITPGKVADTSIDSRGYVFTHALPQYASKYPFGAGIGSVGPAAGVVDPQPSKRLNAESQFTFTIVELGIAGLIVLAALHARLIGLAIRRVRALPYGDLRLMLAAVAAPLFTFLSNWTVGVTTVSTPNSAYVWFAGGVLVYWLHPASRRRTQPQP